MNCLKHIRMKFIKMMRKRHQEIKLVSIETIVSNLSLGNALFVVEDAT